MSRVVITGPSGGAPNRLEINTFVRNEKFFSLYIQALQQVYNSADNDAQSFYQLGGIHGLPYVPWNNATGSTPFDPNAQWGGYCVHGSVLFPTWHRPYMMLFEQTIQTKAKAIAATYTVDKAAWQKAAEDLRQPYWDWAANIIPPDEVIALQNVQITGPNGARVTVPNPLFKYTFHTRQTGFPAPYNQWMTTYRQPTGTVANPTTNVTRLRNTLRASQSPTRTNTYNMLTRVRSWTAFSNHTVGDGGSGTNSLEAIHDQIHVLVGGNGQMSDPGVAAFDPIFFLHHANVDRLLSLWAAINPTVWVAPGDSENGSFTMGAEQPVDTNTPLTPFWNSASNASFWPSASTRSTATLGYTYPEFNGLDMGNPTAVRTAILQTVNRLYSGAATREVSALAEKPMAAAAKVNPVQATFAAERSAPAPAPPPAPAAVPASAHAPAPVPAAAPAHAAAPVHAAHPAQAGHGGSVHVVDHGPGSGFWDWTARIEFEKYELNCSFSVLLFLGPVPDNPDEWLTSPNFVGMHSAFVNSAAGRCANCRHANEARLIEEGFVHLDEGIIRLSGLHDLKPGVVDPWLKENLHWRVEKADGTQATLDSLEVKVFATPLSYPTGADLPVAGERQYFHHVTHGRPGGSRHA